MDIPKLKMKHFFEEVKVHHLDAAIPKSLTEYMADQDLQDTVVGIIQKSRQASQAILAGSAKSGVNPPEIATAMQMGIIIGVGLALELLNEREDPGSVSEEEPEDPESSGPGKMTIQ